MDWDKFLGKSFENGHSISLNKIAGHSLNIFRQCHLFKGAITPKLIKTETIWKIEKIFEENIKKRSICLQYYDCPCQIIINLNYSLYQPI